MSYVVYKLSSGKWCIYRRDGYASHCIASHYKTKKQAMVAARLLAGPCGLIHEA